MASEWALVPVSDIATPVLGGTPSRGVRDYWDGPIKWATAKDITNAGGRYIYHTEESVTLKGLDSSPAKILPKGTIVITARGTVGALAQLGSDMAFNQTCYGLVPKTDNTLADYLYYALRGALGEMRALTYGTVFETITTKTFDHWFVPLLPLSEQRAIAHILGTLDDKIELNRRMNETLEAIARAIFKSWFVEFDPVRAKAEGRDPGLPKEIADLFPDSFEDSELGEIPRGWEIGTLGDVATNPHRGIRPSEIAETTPYIALEHMPKRCITLSEWGTGGGLESNKFEFKKGEILFGKLRPYFHKVGVAPISGVCSTDIVVLSPRSDKWFGVLLGYVSSTDFVEYTNAGSTGTKMPRTSWTEMERYGIVIPPETIAEAFTKQLRPMVDRMIGSIHESRTVAALRDTLLPKLISGEIWVEDGQRLRSVQTQLIQQDTGTIYTVGHSDHSIPQLVSLLRLHAITAVADVRSSPFSRHHPQFNQESLAKALKKEAIAYVFLGKELGGRPDEPASYTNGVADFERMAGSPGFKQGIDRLLKGRDKYRIALLCAEKEPLGCHRTILVSRNLHKLGVPLKHILAGGSVEEHEETEHRLMRLHGPEGSLLDAELSDSERLEKAYNDQARRIAYRRRAKESRDEHTD